MTLRSIPFRARPPWLGAGPQTFRGLLWPGGERPPRGHALWLPLPDGDALAAVLHPPPAGTPPRPLAMLVHGMTGSADDPCVREAAAALLRRGFPVLRLNLRGSAPSLARSRSHYHIGRAQDLADALAALPPSLTGQGVFVAGWSLGGALVLNLLAHPLEGVTLLAGAAICPPLDPPLALAAIDAEPLLRRLLLARYRREVLAVPATDLNEDLRAAARRATSLREFETTVSAPRFGYPSYEVFAELNHPAAALPLIRVPTLLLLAADDPLVPVASAEGIDWEACPAVAPVLVAGGGHCGFQDRAEESLAVRVVCGFFEGTASTGGSIPPNPPSISGS